MGDGEAEMHGSRACLIHFGYRHSFSVLEYGFQPELDLLKQKKGPAQQGLSRDCVSLSITHA